jgi:type IV pilus assembly protein PilC
MAKYLFRGISSSNREIDGEIQAKDRAEAINLIKEKNIRAITIKKKPVELLLSFGSRVKLIDISRFTRQFAAMTSAGLPLVQCMDILSKQTENKTLSGAIRQVSGDIQGGSSLADAFGKHPKIFNSLYCNMVAAGETSGNLDSVLGRLAEYQEKASKLIRKIRGAMIYPFFLASLSTVVTVTLLIFIVPMFAEMFSELGGTLPPPTRIVMAISHFLKSYIIQIIIALVALAIFIYQYRKTEKGEYLIDVIILKIPVLGDLSRKSSISRFSQTLSTLLDSGISIIQALSITAKTAGNKVLEKGIFLTIEKITGGQSIAEPLNETGLFPPMVIHMIAVGEKTGDISSMLKKISTFYEEEVDASVDALTSILEPIMILILGVIIGGILLAMYMPMFEMINLLG